MTKSPAPEQCGWCRRSLPERTGPGRPRRFCRQACRQAAYVAGRRRDELGLSEEELIVARQSLDDLRDRIYVLEAAIEDVERDLAAGDPSEQELQDAVRWLLEAARPLVGSDPNFT
jgi:hypothetical protein